MYCVDFPAYVFHGSFHSEVRIKGEAQAFECKGFLEGEGSRGLGEGEAGVDVKSGGESGGPLGRGFIEHHDLCFFMVDAHMALLCPVLAGVYHRLKLRWGSGYENHVINLKKDSNPVEVIN